MLVVEVKSKQLEAEGIVSLELVSKDGRPLPQFTAGAHIDVHLPGNIVRQYSLCNAPTESHRYQIAVLQDPQSRGGSLAVHNEVEQGATLNISEPKNLFELNNFATRSLLFGGGIGITPMLAMAETLSHQGDVFELHYCTRSQNRAAFVPRLKSSPFAENVFFHFDNGEAEQKLNAKALLAKPEQGLHIYVCGPQGFMDYVLSTAAELGWPENQLHKEYFSAEALDQDGNKEFEIEIKSSGEIIKVEADKTAAQALEEAGHYVSLSCEMGICGACVTKVLAGEPEHKDMFLTVEERAANNQFTPCCSRAKTARLVLDI